jgi:hypothetical protein
MLANPAAAFPAAEAFRAGALSLADGFTFLSGLYFRGKLAYARAFGRGATPLLVMTPTRGLVAPDTPLSRAWFDEFAGVDLGTGDARFRAPLARDAAALASALPRDGRVILLGSVATGKYVDPLAAALGPRLHFPTAFIGRGDMSRGGLLLRAAASGAELAYAVLDPSTARRGARPPKLDPRTRVAVAPGGWVTHG